jgi:tetratricopeptide (TPR) repeat protein
MQYIEGQSLDRVLRELQKLRGIDRGEVADEDLSRQARSLYAVADAGAAGQSMRDTGTLRRDQTRPGLPTDSSDTRLASGGSHYWINVARVGQQIASALRYAHEQKILHRDIKPSNLILDEAGSVWVTDFGLARSFESDRLTLTGEVVGTLRYMPPEQLGGQSDVRSDVYGLGLTLYEMLTLRPANDETDHRALIAQVSDGEAVPPRRIDSSIPRDLETIVLKCMAREPGKRYQSVGEVYDDLTRFVSGEPIQARRIGLAERAFKWARRRPAVAALTLLAILLGTAGVAGITWKWREADRNLREARRQNDAREIYFGKSLDAVDQMLTRVGSEMLADVPYMTEIRTTLLNDALAFYRSLQQQESDDPALQIEAGRIQRQIADINISLGKTADAIDDLTIAIETFDRLRIRFPDRNFVLNWADCKSTRANLLLTQGRATEAEQELVDTIRELEQCKDDVGNPDVAGSQPPGWLQMMANAHLTLGSVQQSTRGSQPATRSYETALQYFEQIPEDADPVTAKMHAYCLDALSRMVLRTNQVPQATALRDEAIHILQRLVQSDPRSPDARHRLAEMQHAKGEILVNRGQLAEARAIVEQAIDTRRQLLRDFPFPGFRRGLADGLSVYAGIVRSLGDFGVAVDAGRESVEISESLVRDFPESLVECFTLARNCHSVATTCSLMNEDSLLGEANEYYRRASDILNDLTERAPRDEAYQYERALALRNWSSTAARLDGDAARGIDMLSEAVTIFESLVQTHLENTTYLYQLAYCRTNLGGLLAAVDPVRSAREFEAACESFVQLIDLQPDEPRFRMQLTRGYGELAKLKYRNGDFAGCVDSLQLAFDNMQQAVNRFGRNANLLVFLTISRNQLAHGLKVLGQTDRAEQLFLSTRNDRTTFLEQHPESVAGRRQLASAEANLAWQLSFWRKAEERDLDQALQHAEEAAGLDHDASKLRICLAHVLLRRGEYQKVLDCLDDGETPEDSDVMGQQAIRGMALWHLDRKAEARTAVTRARKLADSPAVTADIALQLWEPELELLVHEAVELVGE